jgi:hypothetical protein
VIERGRLRASYLLDTYSARKVGGKFDRQRLALCERPARRRHDQPRALVPAARASSRSSPTRRRGLLVTERIGMGFNPTIGRLLARPPRGLWIEGGEITPSVEVITISGQLRGHAARGSTRWAATMLWLSRIGSPSVAASRELTVAVQFRAASRRRARPEE